MVVSPDDGSKTVSTVGVYSHFELNGSILLSESQKKMLDMYDDEKEER